MLPPWDEAGDLPVGIHPANLEEFLASFGVGSPEREDEAEEFLDFVGWATRKGVVRMLVGGSFMTDHSTSNDVDVVILAAPDSKFGDDLPDSWRDAFPFIHVLVAVDESDFESWSSLLAIDRYRRPRGVVEIML